MERLRLAGNSVGGSSCTGLPSLLVLRFRRRTRFGRFISREAEVCLLCIGGGDGGVEWSKRIV